MIFLDGTIYDAFNRHAIFSFSYDAHFYFILFECLFPFSKTLRSSCHSFSKLNDVVSLHTEFLRNFELSQFSPGEIYVASREVGGIIQFRGGGNFRSLNRQNLKFPAQGHLIAGEYR